MIRIPMHACLALAALAAAPLLAQESGPTYWGKPLDGWRKDLREGDVESKRVALEAIASLARWAKPAAPDVVAAFKDEDKEVRKIAFKALYAMKADGVPGWIELLKTHPDASVRRDAMNALVTLGPLAKEAAPTMLAMIRAAKKDTPSLTGAARLLGQLKVEAKALAEIFVDKAATPAARFHARRALEEMRGGAGDAVPVLVDALPRHDAPEIILLLLKSMPLEDTKAAPRVLPFLDHEKMFTRLRAAETMAALDKLPEECRPKLLQLAGTDKARDVRLAALAALASFADAKEAVPLFLDAFKTSKTAPTPMMHAAARRLGENVIGPLIKVAAEENKTQQAIAVLAEVGRFNDETEKYLRGALKSKDPLTRKAVLDALPKFGSKGAGLLGELVASPERMKYERMAAALQLAKMKDITGAVPALLESLKDRDVAPSTLAALGAAGPDPKALDALIAALADDKQKNEAIRSLTKIGPGATKRLIEALGGKDANIRSGALMALTAIGPAAKDAAPALLERLKDGDEATRADALYALARVAPDRRKIFPLLVAAAKDKSPVVRSRAAAGLAHQPDAAAVPVLIPLLAEGGQPRVLILDALAGLGPEAAEAGPAIVALLKTPDPDGILHQHALRAIDAIGPDPDVWIGPVSALLAGANVRLRGQARTLLLRYGLKGI